MRQCPVRHAVGYHTPTDLNHTVFGLIGDDAHVSLQRDGHTDTDGVAVDCGDHRLA